VDCPFGASSLDSCRRYFVYLATNDVCVCVCIADESLTGSSLPESAALAQFNKSWAELTDWLTMLDNMVQNKRVVVADLEDIDDNISRLKVRDPCSTITLQLLIWTAIINVLNYKYWFWCFQVSLQELDQRRPLLDRQVTAAQNLKNKTSNQETRNAITERSTSHTQTHTHTH